MLERVTSAPPVPSPSRGRALVGAFTIDVEEYFHAENLRPAAPPSSWDSLPSRVEGQVDRLLDLLARRGVRGTFFTLGWVAERHPALVARIAAGGHEVASHGYAHDMLTRLDPAAFREDLRRAKAALEDAAQQPVLGYRAPTWTIMRATAWALDVLADEGYAYDSSIFPVRHDRYGDPAAPIVPYRIHRAGGSLWEIPPLVLRALGQNLPAAGGGYLRLLPYMYVSSAVRQAVHARRPVVLYIHPWEIDPGQPRLRIGSRLRSARHYVGLAGTLAKLDGLLGRYPLGRMVDILSRLTDEAHAH